ncbi:MAG: response regulator [candidate division NC10 bacterium]|nr:response regulator [candidate division NC10 bacterium]
MKARVMRILLVDNDRFILEAVGELLREAGYAVETAADGLEALEQIAAAPPDILVLDVVMPKIDGARLCRYLEDDPRLARMPVIVFSSLAAPDLLALPGLRGEAFVAKGPLPVVGPSLLQALAKAGQGNGEPQVYGYEGFRPRQVVAELLHLKQQQDLLLQHIRDGVLLADGAGRVTEANPAAVRLLGASERSLLGRPVHEVFEPAHRGAVRRLWDALLRGSESTDCLTVHQEGRPLRVRFSPVGSRTVPATIVLILTDLTGTDPLSW